MSDQAPSAPHWAETPEAELTQYRSLSGMAVTGLILGVLGVLGLFTPILWPVAWAGVVLSALALVRIARHPQSLAGRGIARAGLALAVFFACMAPAQRYAYQAMVRAQARQFAELWFDLLRRNEPHKAYQLTRHPAYRKPLDERLWKFYGQGTEAREELEHYVKRPEVRTLLALGPRAEIQYFDTQSQGWQDGHDVAYQVFAVSFADNGRRKTFFVGVNLERHELPATGKADWRIGSTEGGIRPLAFGQQSAGR